MFYVTQEVDLMEQALEKIRDIVLHFDPTVDDPRQSFGEIAATLYLLRSQRFMLRSRFRAGEGEEE